MKDIGKKLEKLKKQGKFDKYRNLAFDSGAYYNVTTYAKNFNRTFEEVPFQDADSLVFCQLAYADLRDFVGKKLREVYDLITDYDKICPYHQKDNLELINAMQNSIRFGEAVIIDARERFSEEDTCQFGITAFDIGEYIYFACRGTAHKIVGWLENIDIVVYEELPSHRLTKLALNEIGKATDKKIIVGGHSKGGNAAVECAAFCEKSVQDKIIKVYDHDGPGLLPSIMEKEGMKNILSRVDKTVPELSVFGMFLHEGIEYRTVYSHDKGVWQHYAFNWQIDQTSGTLISVDTGTNRPSRVVKTVIELVLPTMTHENRVEFRTFVANLVQGAGIVTMDDFTKKNVRKMIKLAFKQHKERRKYVRKLLAKVIRSIFKAEILVYKERKKEKV